MLLTDFSTYADAQRLCTPARLWELFDGDRRQLNIAHECVDRHAESGRIAVILIRADGSQQSIGYDEIAALSSAFAHELVARGIRKGDRVAVMLEPSLAFYATVFGAIKAGAIAVPLFTLFGPDGVKLRIDDCKPRMLVVAPEHAHVAPVAEGRRRQLAAPPRGAASEVKRGGRSSSRDETELLVIDDDDIGALSRRRTPFALDTRADDEAIWQYTSGTTRELPEAVRHEHRAIVTLMLAALYGTGLRPGDRFFCPSSPAWGHGLWHGTLAPLALGLTIGAYAGKFDAKRLLEGLSHHRFTNVSAAATHYRMMRTSGVADQYAYRIDKLSFTGEPIDSETAGFVERTFGTPACSMYGTTEVGVVLVNYPGASDFNAKPGSLGKPLPGGRVEVQDASGTPVAPGVVGELKVWRKERWIPTRDLARIDDDGYFFHAGRADDVIISAGWTMSAVEIEDAIMKHPAVREAAVIGVPDTVRGQVVKAYIVADREGDDVAREIQDLVRTRLSAHEYPRLVAFTPELPKTPAGKVNRRVLRERESLAARTS
ncbi:MAG TPA: acyl-CoA synthetase [Casimicrobiaceae bacterium]|nr:acyl-CoA synthetase [Casimicrobiaceae bacterium]